MWKNCFTFPIVACFAIQTSKQASKQLAELCFLRLKGTWVHTRTHKISISICPAAMGSFLLCFPEKAENMFFSPCWSALLCSWDNRVRLRGIERFFGEFATLERLQFTKPNTPKSGAKSFWKSHNLFVNNICAYMHTHGHSPTTRSSDCTCSLKVKVCCFITVSWSFCGETHLGKWHSLFTLVAKLLQC